MKLRRFKQVFMHANQIMACYPPENESPEERTANRKRLKETIAAIPKPLRFDAETLARRQWVLWNHCNFIFPWCTERKPNG